MEAPQVIRIKRRIDEDPVQALVVQSERRKKLKTDLVFHLTRTERWHNPPPKPTESPDDEGKGRIPIVRATDSALLGITSKQTRTLSPPKLSSGIRTPSKRKSPVDSTPQSPAGTIRISSLIVSQNIPDINHTPPTPLPKDKYTEPNIPPSPNAKLLQVPQPRKFHLTHKHRPSRSVPASPTRRGTPVQKKTAIFMGEENILGRTVPSHRASKRRREKKEELRFVRSKESLRGDLGRRSSSISSISSIASLEHEIFKTGTLESMGRDGGSITAPIARKRPRVHPKEKEQREKLRKGKQTASTVRDSGPRGTVPTTSKPKRRQQISDDVDDEMADALQKMVIDYLSTQAGITNLPPTETIFHERNPDKKLGAFRGLKKVENKASEKQMDTHAMKTEQDITDGEETEEEGWVYDVYVRENALSHASAGGDIMATVGSDYGVLVISNSDDEEWFYEGGWDDGDDTGDGRSDDQDSNAEDYFTNDYPDEDEGADYPDDEMRETDFGEDNDDYDYNEYEKLINAIYSVNSVNSSYSANADDEDDMRILRKLNSKKRFESGRRVKSRRTLPDDEEYDLAEYDTETDDEEKVNNAVRRNLERGVWGLAADKGRIGRELEIGRSQESEDDKMAMS